MSEQLCIHELRVTECAICNGVEARLNPRREPAAKGYADAIFDLIPVEAEGWIGNAALADAAGLSPAQAAAGVAYLRDNYPELPLVSNRQGYCFTLNEADVSQFRLSRQRSALTIYRRLWRGVVKPFLDKRVVAGEMDKVTARYITKQFERLLQDLDEMTST